MLWLVLFSSLLWAQRVHEIRPGQNPQAVADAAAAGDRLVFLPGVHEHPLRKHQSLLYVEKALDIELQAGATLRLASLNRFKCESAAKSRIRISLFGRKFPNHPQ